MYQPLGSKENLELSVSPYEVNRYIERFWVIRRIDEIKSVKVNGLWIVVKTSFVLKIFMI